jgi:hypothetical protein
MKKMSSIGVLLAVIALAYSGPDLLQAETPVVKGEEIVVPAIQAAGEEQSSSAEVVVMETQSKKGKVSEKKTISVTVSTAVPVAKAQVPETPAPETPVTTTPEKAKYQPSHANAYLDLEKESDKPTQAASVERDSSRCEPKRYRVYNYMPDSLRSQGTATLLSDISIDVAGKVFYQLKDDGEKNYTARVAVVAAVPLSDLKRETEFGRVMAEFLLTDLADRGLKVKELRLGKEINILAQTGEFILSRNIGELASVSPELDYVVVSTFTNTRKMLIVQGRLVNLKNGLVKTSWRYTMPLNRELLGLFHTIEKPYTIAVKGMLN